MKKILCLFLIFPLLFTACIEDEDDRKSPDSKIQIGDRLPSFTVKDLEGTEFSSATLSGKVTLIVFFDTGCGDCHRELPKVDSLYLHYQDNPAVALVCIAREHTAEEVRAYWYQDNPGLKLPFSMPAYVENSPRQVYNLFAEKYVPRFYLAGKDGKVSWIGTEKINENVEDLKQKIDNLLLD